MIYWNLLKHQKDVVIVDENGNPLLQGDNDRRFLKHRGCINTTANIIFLIPPAIHYLCYAVGDNPMAHLHMVAEF